MTEEDMRRYDVVLKMPRKVVTDIEAEKPAKNKCFQSYQAGFLDTSRAIVIDPGDVFLDADFNYPGEDEEELDTREYIRGQINVIIGYLRVLKDKT